MTTLRWSARLLDEQFAFVTPTRHHGQSAPGRHRNPLTTEDDLALIIETMR